MRKRAKRARQFLVVGSLVCAFVVSANAQTSSELPRRPEAIPFPALQFEPPRAQDYRQVIGASGVPSYFAPSRELPLIRISFVFRAGSYLDPADKVGLAELTGDLLRRGGSRKRAPEVIDARLDFLATELEIAADTESLEVSLDCLASTLDESLALCFELLREPEFAEERLELAKAESLELMRQRNDDAGDILEIEWGALAHGRTSFQGRVSTVGDLERITREDLRAFHRRFVHPKNLMIGAVGAFETAELRTRLERAIEGWAAGEVPARPQADAPTWRPGLYHVEKDIPQGKVALGLPAIGRGDPDEVPLLIMNNILGGGGFTSRLVGRVRSREGLAYSVGSDVTPGLWGPGEFRAEFQSKNNTVALALKIILEEIARLRSEPVSAEELATAQNSYVETFPRNFESPAAMIELFLDDELTGRPGDWWTKLRDRIRAVTPADVQRVAARHLDPAQLAILVVGAWNEIDPGDPAGRAKMSDVGGAKVVKLPLRDPLTQESIAPAAKP
ncbi:MAG: M16 family metallopeptidase [Planctomycetota bacterium]